MFEAPFWVHPMENWNTMFDCGVRNHLLASRFAAPIMVRQERGLVVTTTFWDRDRYLRGSLFYDFAKSAMNRLAFGMAQELRPHGVASLAASPGWMRTEFILAGHSHDHFTVVDAMDLALLTGQRPADVLKLKRTDIRDGALWVVQNKAGACLGIEITGELAAVISRINERSRKAISPF